MEDKSKVQQTWEYVATDIKIVHLGDEQQRLLP